MFNLKIDYFHIKNIIAYIKLYISYCKHIFSFQIHKFLILKFLTLNIQNIDFHIQIMYHLYHIFSYQIIHCQTKIIKSH